MFFIAQKTCLDHFLFSCSCDVSCLFICVFYFLCMWWMPWVDVLFYLAGWNLDIKHTSRLLYLPWSLVVTPISCTSRHIIWDSGKFTKPSHYGFIVYIVLCSWFWHIEGNVHLYVGGGFSWTLKMFVLHAWLPMIAMILVFSTS